MKQRRLSNHWLPLAVTTAFIISWQSIATAQSLCAPIFQRYENSQKTIGDIIQDLAKLKLQIDLAHTQTQQSPQAKALEKEFVRLTSELVQKTSYTKQELKKSITAKIAELQHRQVEELTKESQIREQQKALTPKAKLKSQQQLPADFHFMKVDKGNIVFLAETQEILFVRNQNGKTSLLSYSLLNKDIQTLIEETSIFTLSTDRKNIYALDSRSKLQKLDLATRQIVSEVILKNPTAQSMIPANEYRLVISPDEKYIVTTHHNVAHVHDLLTGEKVGQDNRATSEIKNLIFTSNKTFVMNTIKGFEQFEIGNQVRPSPVAPVNGVTESWIFSQDGASIISTSYHSIVINSEKVLERETSVLNSFPKVFNIPAKDKNLVLMTTRRDEIAVYDLKDTENPVYDFDGYYKNMKIDAESVLTSPDGKQIVIVILEDWKSKKYRIDIWDTDIR